MKKLKFLTVLLIAVGALNISNAKASEVIEGRNVTMTKEEYENLRSQGFSDFDVLNISESEFNRLKDLKGEIVSEEVKYYKTTYPTTRFYTTTVKPITEEITKEEYDSIGTAVTRDATGTFETVARKITTTISAVSGKYRYNISTTWKTMPSIRSYDLIGIGMDSKVKLSGPVTFAQVFCSSTSLSSCSSLTAHNLKSTSTGIAASFVLKSGTYKVITVGLYYDVVKNTTATITAQNAIGHYVHAVETVPYDPITSITSIGQYGIIIDGSFLGHYERISTVDANWTGSW